MKLAGALIISMVLGLQACSSRVFANENAMAPLIKKEISSRWISSYEGSQHAFVLSSPAYPLEYEEGCVIYRQSFPVIGGKISFARMEFYKYYYATAFDEDCSKVDVERFFEIEGDAEPYAVLDFVRRVYSGPNTQDDITKQVSSELLRSCFSGGSVDDTYVVRAESVLSGDAEEVKFRVVFKCKLVGNFEGILATGSDEGPITWNMTPIDLIDVDGMR